MSTKKLWTNETKIIEDELFELIKNRTPLLISQPDFPSHTVFAKSIEREGNKRYLTFYKPTEFTTPTGKCFFFYRVTDHNCLARSFEAVLQADDTSVLSVLFPKEIHQVSRRKHVRVSTKPPSVAIFTPSGSSRVNRGELVNVSQEGALMNGMFLSTIKEGDTIGPIHMTLNLKNKKIHATEIVIPEAKIIRKVTSENATKTLAIHFKLSGIDHDNLETFITMRIMEENQGAQR